MKKYCLNLTVSSSKQLNERYVLLKLTHERPLPDMMPGQFVEVKVDGSPHTYLRRPISINFFDRENNELWLLIAIVGEGTKQLSLLQTGDLLNCVFPLGRGFTLPSSPQERILLVGGGVGVAPLLYLGHIIRQSGGMPTFLLGARSATAILERELFEQTGRLYLTTEDGTAGERGFVTQHSILAKERFHRIVTCGPTPMMKALARYAKAEGICCEVSLENMMACGIGACLCCVEKTVKGHVCVCTEGPVFNSNDLLWQL